MLRLRPRHAPFVLTALLFLGAAPGVQAQAVRYHHTMTLMADGNILIVGGKGAANTSLNTVDIYISTGAKYETRAVMNVNRSSHTATLLPDGRVLVTGGVNAAGTILDTGELFDPRLNSWTPVSNANFGGPRVNHTATLLPNGKVLITGGETAVGLVLNTCSLFSAGAFTACGAGGAMQMERAGHTATLLHNGRVLAAGGYRSAGSGFAPTTEIYDPVGDSWFSGPAISARAFHSATQMGNQRVLIAGGFNGVNLRENQGVLATTEIYDPNSNSVTPGAPMAERKMHHTAVLDGNGTVNMYAGLGNITTTFFTGDQTLQQNSVLALNAVPGTWLVATVNGAPTNLFIRPNVPMSVAASGIVVDGAMNFSSPTLAGTDFQANFNYPDGTIAPVDGAVIDEGILMDQTFEVSTIGGNAVFSPQQVTSDDMILTAGSQLTAAGPFQPAVATPLTGGTLNGTIRVPLPPSNVGGTVQVGVAFIGAGAITRPSNETTQGFDVVLSSGVASIVGGTVINDTANGPIMSLAVSFTGLEGDVTNSTQTVIGTPLNVAGLKVTGLELLLFYVITPLNVTDLSLTNDVATITVRSMIFADQERYAPNQNAWTFGAPGAALFNHGQTLLPNGDQFFYGGRRCTSVANCAAGTFTAQNTRSAYIHLNHEKEVWGQTGTLSAARSNLTVTQLPNGSVLAAGGANASTTLDAAEVFDPSSQVWTVTAKMKRSRSHHTATLLPNGNVLALGGFTALGNSTGTTSHAEIYYPNPGAWVPTAPMASSRAFHGTVLLPNGSVLAMGGFSNGAYLASTEIFYSTGHRWYPGPAMPEARAQYTTVVLRDGKIMVVGGLNAVSGVLNSTRFYDPASQLWSSPAGTNLNFGRHSHTATLLRDGRVLVVGGNDGSGEVALAEIFDPSLGTSGQWRRVTALGGNDLGIARQNHTATLLPDGKVMIVGGFTALGGAVAFNEGFDVDFSSFQIQGQFGAASRRGDHSVILLSDGNLLAVGGFDGLSYLNGTEGMYYGSSPDAVTLAGGLPRRPRIDAAVPRLLAPGTAMTARGANFRGLTEASGGGGGSANAAHAHPRVYLNRADGASSSANDAGWMVDLTSGMFTSGINSWQNMDSSLTFTVPGSQSQLPFGWYHLRVAANSQFSVSTMVQVGPALPTGTPGVPTGVAVGPSSVAWTWAAAAGAFDGYSVYSATSGVFLSTVPKSGGGTESFLQRDLGPDTSTLIRVAAYNISGDGTAAVSTVPVLTAVSNINGTQGIAQDTRSIFWSWNPVSGAISYDVFSATSGTRIIQTAAPSFTQTLLSTNTPYGIQVMAIMPGGNGSLSDAATAFTLAAAPTQGSPPLTLLSTGSFVAQWLGNENPVTTRFHIKLLVGSSTEPVHISSVPSLSNGFVDLLPNTFHQVSVAAFNGDGRYTPFISLGSTYTFARAPLDARVVAADPSGVTLVWDTNGNPGNTPYQVLFSSDNFVADFSTHIAFSAAYTSPTANIGGLITGQTYAFRVLARNVFGQETASASTQAFTDNGGGPPGSLSLLAPTTVYAALSGTLGSGRRFEVRIPAGSFDQDTRIFITTTTNIPAGACGNIAAKFSVTNLPAIQPRLPVEVGLQFNPLEANIGSLATLGMVRYDPVSGACVPMESRVDVTNNMLYARLNHFSDFQLQQLVPGAAASSARVFPNPLYTRTQGFFTFDHLPASAHVRVFTLHGEEVFDQGANASGIVTWRAQNKVGRPVASGIYLAVIESGGERKIMKVVVVR